MSTDIALSAASRASLLSLQNTQNNVDRTNNRLSTGLKVGSAIDDAVAYFQAKSLADRADDLTARKDKIDQGISALKVTVNATANAATLIKNMKGILDAARSQSATQRAAAAQQLNTLVYQIDKLVRDASYQGLNLLNSSSSTLTVYFSEKSDSKLDVKGINALASQLYINSNTSPIGMQVTNLASGISAVLRLGLCQAFSLYQISTVAGQNALNSKINLAVANLDRSIGNLNAKSSNFGTSVAILQTRLDFTKDYVNNLKEGAGKLTLADSNEEGANLLALQTRQQMGIKVLSFAGQSEQAVLQLFR